ncbi:MAG: lysophospholipid acyltransferase family protein [Myxococcota bacterium]
MAKLYRTLRRVIKSALDMYFVEIRCTGLEYVPDEGPVIFAANHPNSIMDSLILATETRRPVSFLARSGLFENPLFGKLLDWTGMIPIYRPQDTDSDTEKNEQTFRRAFEHLEDGNVLGIFPEGQNSLERRVRQIKTGAARIALGSEARNDFDLGVRIIPVGLNFEDRDQFLSSVLVRFGEPIVASDFAESYGTAPKETVREVTERIGDGLRSVIVTIEDERHEWLVQSLFKIYGHERLERLAADFDIELRSLSDRLLDTMRSTGYERGYLEDKFDVEQEIADLVSWLEDERPIELGDLRRQVLQFEDHLGQVRLKHDFLERPPETLSSRKEAAKLTVFSVLFGPIAAWGFINNFIPYQLSKQFALRASEEAIRAFTAFCVGLVAFPLFYGLQSWLVFRWTGSWFDSIGYLLTVPLAGFFFLRYRRQIAKYRDRILARTFFRTEGQLVRSLERERQRIVRRVDELRREQESHEPEGSKAPASERVG